jgi:hypothetical protein
VDVPRRVWRTSAGGCETLTRLGNVYFGIGLAIVGGGVGVCVGVELNVELCFSVGAEFCFNVGGHINSRVKLCKSKTMASARGGACA